jgi:hypothetical protein
VRKRTREETKKAVLCCAVTCSAALCSAFVCSAPLLVAKCASFFVDGRKVVPTRGGNWTRGNGNRGNRTKYGTDVRGHNGKGNTWCPRVPGQGQYMVTDTRGYRGNRLKSCTARLAALGPLSTAIGSLLGALGLLLAGLGSLLADLGLHFAALGKTCKNHPKIDAQND